MDDLNKNQDKNKANSELRKSTFRGIRWSMIDNFARLGGQFIIGIVLARLLNPTDFGLIGMLTVFIVVGQTLSNSGFGQALIQKKDVSDIDYSTVFYFNIFASIVLYLVFFFSAPLIADFYDQPQLIPLTKVLCLSIVIESIGRIHVVHLEKQLNFKSPSVIGVISVLSSGAISIVLALNGFGVWSLVALTITKSIVATILLWFFSNWKPMLKFSGAALKRLFNFGSGILAASLIQSLFRNLYHLVIGRYYSAQILGYYTKAAQFRELPINAITMVVQKVTFPVFSKIQDDDTRLISGYTKAIRMLAAIVLPAMVLIFAAAQPFILLVLGAKWLPVVPYLKVMVLYGWLKVIFTINNQIITVKGKSNYYLQIQIIDRALIVVSIFLTYKYGIMTMIYGHMVATVFTYLTVGIYLKKVFPVTIFRQLKELLPFLFAAVIMLFSVILISLYIKGTILYFFSSVLISSIIYIFLLWILKVNELKTGAGFIKEFLQKIFLKLKLPGSKISK